jgi:1,4-alpha-glucan branching enzyme
MLLVVCNFNPVLREAYSLGAPVAGTYKEILNSDDAAFGGTGAVHNKSVRTKKTPMHGFDQSITLTLPPMSTLYFEVPSPRRKLAGKKTEQAADKAEEKAAKKTAKAAAKAEEKAAAPKRSRKAAKAEEKAAEEKPAKRTRKPKAESSAKK